MKKVFWLSVYSLLLAAFCLHFSAINPKLLAISNDYVINNFNSQIEVNQDTSLTITETIETYFNVQKHGIFRIIPVIYSAGGQTIRAKLKIISVTDEKKQPIPFTAERYQQSYKIQIGDPNKTLTGKQTYVIKYQVWDVLRRYKDHDEVYWNITGSEWDTIIQKASAAVNSSFADITKAGCYSGIISTQAKNCTADFSLQQANSISTIPITRGNDFTIVVGLNPQNSLKFPGQIAKGVKFIKDNWGYLVALTPLAVLFFVWLKKGRDKRYLSDNIYVKNDSLPTQAVSIFHHKYLPMVYSPIDSLTPSQVGTIIDEKVDTKDVIAEIIELARLGFLKIKKIETKKFLGKNIDYLFSKEIKSPNSLNEYQKFLLEKIFETGIEIKLSDLKNTFYVHLEIFRQKLYRNLVKEKIFNGNPRTARAVWAGVYIGLMFLSFGLLIVFAVTSANSGPLIFHFSSIIPAVFIIKNMSSRTAWGYSLFHQIGGLRYFLDKGKWRQEISEKNLFFEEILPLAICLGLVHKLANDMEALGIKPPSYLQGFTAGSFVSDLSHFSSYAATSFISRPTNTSWSGSSHWSGGSGFSGGGGSGGGFGGGGGGSW